MSEQSPPSTTTNATPLTKESTPIQLFEEQLATAKAKRDAKAAKTNKSEHQHTPGKENANPSKNSRPKKVKGEKTEAADSVKKDEKDCVR